MKLNKIIILIILLLTLIGCKNSTNYYTVYYEGDLNDFDIDYNNDNDIYEVFIEEEQRYIYIPRSSTEIILCDDNDIVIVENYKSQYDYYFRLNKPVSVKMYFYIAIDWDDTYD